MRAERWDLLLNRQNPRLVGVKSALGGGKIRAWWGYAPSETWSLTTLTPLKGVGRGAATAPPAPHLVCYAHLSPMPTP
jgi:hypothetical protein